MKVDGVGWLFVLLDLWDFIPKINPRECKKPFIETFEVA